MGGMVWNRTNQFYAFCDKIPGDDVSAEEIDDFVKYLLKNSGFLPAVSKRIKIDQSGLEPHVASSQKTIVKAEGLF